MPRSPHARRERVIATWMLGLYLAALAVIAFWPEHVDRDAGWLVAAIGRAVPLLADGRLEWIANVVLFVPFGALGLVLMRSRPLLVIALALVVSGGIELVQAAFPGRTSSVLDVVANTLGAGMGVGVVMLLRRVTRAGDTA